MDTLTNRQRRIFHFFEYKYPTYQALREKVESEYPNTSLDDALLMFYRAHRDEVMDEAAEARAAYYEKHPDELDAILAVQHQCL